MYPYIFLFMGISVQLSGQITFNKKFHFNYTDAALGSIHPTDSCYYATGIVVDTAFPYLVGNIFVKFDLDGTEIFNKPLISGHEFIETWFGDLIPTVDGSLLTIGQISDTIANGLILKYNTSGDTILTKKFLSPYYPDYDFIVPVQVVQDTSGKIVVLSAISKPTGNNDICLSFFDSQLNLINHKTFGNQYDEIPGNSVMIDEEGILFGANRDNTNLNSQNLWSKAWVVHTDTTGVINWEYLPPSSMIQDRAACIIKSKNGGLVVASNRGFEKIVNAELSFIYWESAYFFKLDKDQNLVWDLEVFDSINPGPTQGVEQMISVDNGEAYVAAGRFNMIRSLNPPVGGTYGWFFKFSDDGQLIWIRKYQILDSLGHQHRIFNIKPTADGGIISIGEVHGNWGTNEPSLQAWLLKLDSFGCLIPGCQWQDTVTVSGQPGKVAAELAIYPNPTSDYLNFQLRSPQAIPQATFRILDAAGRVVKEFQSTHTGDTVIVPVWDWAPGVYFLEASAQGRVLKVEKFVVTK